MPLTWADLLIEDISPEDFQSWLGQWSGFIAGRVALVFMNKFGSWFLRRPEGHVEMLNVFTGALERVADSYEGFIAQVNEQWWQEICLLSELVYQLHQIDVIPGPGQCYAIAPHPALGGPNPMLGHPIDPHFVMLMDIGVWQSVCAQSVRGSG